MGFLNFAYNQLFTHIPVPEASFAGQTVIVTGANTGLGKEAARHIVRLGADKVIIGVRNTKSGEEAARDIERTTGRSGVCEVWELDLSSFDSVRAFAARASSELTRLDGLLENAGVATQEWELLASAGNNERTVAVNVASTFLLALLLLPKLRETARNHRNAGSLPRLTIVSSDAHSHSDMPQERKYDDVFGALNDRARADFANRYPVSKLLEIMVVRQMAPLMGSEDEVDVVLNTVSPGFCHSELAREATGFQAVFFTVMKAFLARSTEVGGRTLVNALSFGRKSHGKYIDHNAVGEPSDFVRSEEGEKTAVNVWTGLKAILENAQPGVTGNLKA